MFHINSNKGNSCKFLVAQVEKIFTWRAWRTVKRKVEPFKKSTSNYAQAMFFSVQDYSNGHIYNNLLWQCKHGDSCHVFPHRLSTSTPLHETELGHLCTLDSGTPMYNTWQATRLWECAAPLHEATEAVLDCWSCISTSALHMVELLIDCTIAALSLYHSGNPDFSRMTFAQKHRGGLAFAHFVQSLFLRLFKMTASQIAMANCIKLAKAKSSKFHARMHFFAVCTFLPVE